MDLRIGDKFSTWVEFTTTLDDYQRTTNTVWTIAKSRSVEAANKRLKQPPFYPQELVHAYVRLGCKHYGKCKSLSTGERVNQRYVIFKFYCFQALSCSLVSGCHSVIW